MKKINRRSFVGTTAAAAAGISVAGGTRTEQDTGSVSANDKIHVALIGCGGMGRSDLGDFLRIPEVECLALADVDLNRVDETTQMVEERRGKKPDGYQDYRRIIERDDVHAVIVATPDHWHALPTVEACMAGKDVYVEKPLATSIDEGRHMLAAARKHGRVVQVGTQQRSAQHFADAVDFVKSGKLGRIRMVRAWAYLDWKGGLGNPANQASPEGVDYDFWLGPAPERPFNPARFHFTFRWFWDYSGGLMTDWGAHMVDIVDWAMEEDPVGAMAVGGKYGYPDDIMETPDTQQSIVEYPSFSLVWEHMLGCGVGPWQREHGVEFHGQNGILIVDRGGWEVHSETDDIDRPNRVYRMQPMPRQNGSRNYHFTHVQNFVDCMRSRKQPNSDIEKGHKSAVSCHLANIAARLQRYVKWDPAKQEIVGDAEAASMAGREYRSPWALPKIS